MMKYNKLRYLLNNNLPSVGTRLWTTRPFFTEAVGTTGNYDYIEFLAENTPFDQHDLEAIAMAAELHEMGTMIKVDFQGRGYVAQRAIGAGFQSILFTDCHNAEEVRESVRMVRPDRPSSGGVFGFPNRRYIGWQARIPGLKHADRLDEVVLAFMIEKKSAMDNIEAICTTPGVDMVQFGPNDFCMSCGLEAKDNVEMYKEAEREMIRVALKHGKHPRCEIQTVDAAQYYIDLGVRHFCLGDQLIKLLNIWTQDGGAMRNIMETL